MMSSRRRRQRKPAIPITDLAEYPLAYTTLSALRTYWQEDDRTIRKWILSGKLPAYRFGRGWRIKVADALAFEEQSKFRSA
jgi:excisionase family DNA binding protein